MKNESEGRGKRREERGKRGLYELSGHGDEEDEAQREGLVRKETKEQKSGHASLEARLRLNDVCVGIKMRG